MDRELDKFSALLYYIEKIVVKLTSYLLPLASKTSIIQWYVRPSRALTLICLSCCAISS